MSESRVVPVPQYMRTTEPHITVGAYALGVLGGAAFRFVEHLADCAECRARAREFAGVRADLAVAGPPAAPGSGFAERLTAAVTAGRRRWGRRLVAVER
ncbi:anti-sigma factor family protein [Streptomyces anulatus]|uniref:anti-sigma factor family protein n=1 Tax=Streptomyces anulatus TaxID=1892 RepID=UPI0033C8F6A8